MLCATHSQHVTSEPFHLSPSFIRSGGLHTGSPQSRTDAVYHVRFRQRRAVISRRRRQHLNIEHSLKNLQPL